MMVDGGKAFLQRMVGMIKWNERSMDMASLELPFFFNCGFSNKGTIGRSLLLLLRISGNILIFCLLFAIVGVVSRIHCMISVYRK
jgi:hypothetical protein